MNRFVCFMLSILFASSAFAAWTTATPSQKTKEKAGFTQNLGAQVPLALTFRDEKGRTVHLSDYVGQHPVILNLVYFECPMLCTETLNGLVRAIRPLRFNAGQQYNIVTVSFDPHEASTLAAAKKRIYLERYDRPGAEAGWTFLTGDESSIRTLANSVGFHYVWNAELGQFDHGTGLIILTPGGKVSHYLYGVEYPVNELRLALLEAADGRIGSWIDKLWMDFYSYDPITERYRLNRMSLLGLVVGITFLLSSAFMVFLTRQA